MGRIGFPELLVILVIVLLFVGGKRLPGLSRALGQALRDFQQAVKGKGRDRSGKS